MTVGTPSPPLSNEHTHGSDTTCSSVTETEAGTRLEDESRSGTSPELDDNVDIVNARGSP
eukprot:CAMPEP_0198685908 /NCGR_PEP_ID=MMETSP1468-20131203/14243_1 /TAXON_ID=1461545 /ORGANISM="Mantoniella sp, Strain CCMP1436" /LENGTH=59 /DNA_ID=CAMNT_0044431669 /DNA_START=671 /DNA_END=846 /DNA_ORIENTATION=+